MRPWIIAPCCPFSLCLQSFPVSRSFPMSQVLASSGQSIGASASAAVLPMNIQDWFSLGLTGLISLQSKGLLESSPVSQFKSINFLVLMVRYHHWHNGHEFEQTPGDSGGQRSLARCSPLGLQRVGHNLATEQQWIIKPCHWSLEIAESLSPKMKQLAELHERNKPGI